MRKVLIAALFGSLATIVGCGGGSGSTASSGNNTVTTTGQNVLAISVNNTPVAGVSYANGAFASATVCTPGSTTSCTTISGLLVDTGSVGLRVLASALTASLPAQTDSSSNPINECIQFADNSFVWGPVETADVTLGSEKASSIPIQVIEDTTVAIPTSCSNGFTNEDTSTTLGANGILGVGQYLQDCGGACTLSAANPGVYYSCPTSGCVVTNESLTSQVQNLVSFFSTDNNGVIIELPAVSGTAATVSGSLIFGIGTQSNNGLGSAKVYTMDSTEEFIDTSFNGTDYPESFLDSGSNGYFFDDSSITQCGSTDIAAGFYCPGSPLSLSATSTGANGTNASISFGVGNADTLFNTNPTNAAFSTLAGPNTSGSFDWGLPFFYGRNVFTAIEGQSTPGGTGPYWAY